jgi:uncharacterized protein (TIGR02646 family)
MTLVEIDTTLEPECLTELRNNKENTFSNLQGECRQEVVNLLRSSQNILCAYCQRSISDVMTIEHYYSQSDFPDLQLIFSNFLGVCSGKFYIDKKTGKHIEHCDTRRGNIPLNIDPRNTEHIDTIYYESDGKIKSSKIDLDNDLNNTLNLNFSELCEKRNEKFKEYLDLQISQGHDLHLGKAEIFRRAIVALNNTFPEYCGYFRFRLETLKNETRNE